MFRTTVRPAFWRKKVIAVFDNTSRVLVVAAHPDDEVLGCGATVARLTESGTEVRTLIMATGSLSRESGTETEVVALEKSAGLAAETLGVNGVGFGRFPDNAMDTVALLKVAQRIEEEINAFRPTLVMTHHCGDLNIDHRITHEAVLTACRPLPDSVVRTILAFETVSSTEWQSGAFPAFVPNVYVECSDTLATKLAALAHYESEMRPAPHSRSLNQVRDLAAIRGRESGHEAAEVFQLIRHIVPNQS
jgi:LmbE family N-acetylglucosaminyl deacetylase